MKMNSKQVSLMCLGTLCLFLALVGYVVYPAKATFDSTTPYTVSSYSEFGLNGYTFYTIRNDIYKADGHYVSFSINGVGGRRQQLQFSLDTDEYPYAKIYGPWQPPQLGPSPNGTWPNPPIYNASTIPTYYWHGLRFVQAGIWDYPPAPGGRQGVAYDHPDNYYTYHPGDWWDSYNQKGSDGYGFAHMGIFDMQALILKGDIATGFGAFIGLIAALLGFGPPGWVVALAVALTAAFCVAIGWAVGMLATYVLQTENGDGFTYAWGAGHWDCWWLHSYWYSLSFGRWRDWQWHVFISNFCGSWIVPV